MQVFTTVYLVEALRADIRRVEETPGLERALPAVREFKDALQQKIAYLERQPGRSDLA